eukprot:Colp12_sorted_trinity150504_noHs@3814
MEQSTDTEFRICTREDIPELVSMINRSYDQDDIDFIYEGTRTCHACLQSVYEKTTTLAAFKDGKIVASVQLEREDDELFKMSLLAIDKDVKRQGLFTKMTTQAESHVRAQGGKKIQVNVVSPKPWLRALYEKRGYVEQGSVPSAEIQPHDHKFICEFVFWVMVKTL